MALHLLPDLPRLLEVDSRKMIKPSKDLLISKQAVQTLKNVSLLDDWSWDEQSKKWILHFRVYTKESATSVIPEESDWCAVVDEKYPLGYLEIFPAKENGIDKTFPHQNYNSFGIPDRLWRDGKLCLDTTVKILGRDGMNSEPMDKYGRLLWYVQRTQEWIRAANEGKLAQEGEPFELPFFPAVPNELFAFQENSSSYLKWKEVTQQAGIVFISKANPPSTVKYATHFSVIDNNYIHLYKWGIHLNSIKQKEKGIWLKLPQVPVFDPWQIPKTWGELRSICQQHNIDLDSHLKKFFPEIRDGKYHLLLLGFAIPKNYGETSYQLHWQAIRLPIVSYGNFPIKGFRTNEFGYWHRDIHEIIVDNAELQWAESSNWDAQEISSRAKMNDEVISQSILMIGGGALGSMIAESLVRSGVKKMTIIDADGLNAGNLVRHTLSMDEIDFNKASALAKKLNAISPHAEITYVMEAFPGKDDLQDRINSHDVIVDCTGSDEVLLHMDGFPWQGKKLFFSFSMGFKIDRIFCFSDFGKSFAYAKFRKLIDPWLEKQIEENKDYEFPREGIGCWHPIFPGRFEDVAIMSSIAVKQIEEKVALLPKQPTLSIFEKKYEKGSFAGIERIV